jgi:hypothetical protein
LGKLAHNESYDPLLKLRRNFIWISDWVRILDKIACNNF